MPDLRSPQPDLSQASESGLTTTNHSIWARCLDRLESVLSESEVGTWIRPLQARHDGNVLALLAPNRPVLSAVQQRYLSTIETEWQAVLQDPAAEVRVSIGTAQVAPPAAPQVAAHSDEQTRNGAASNAPDSYGGLSCNRLDKRYVFSNFVEGKSNQIARAAAQKVAETPASAYNPLLIYGGTGLGKTHLMHSAGNRLLADQPGARIIYLPAERFVNDMVAAVRHNQMDQFKAFYRSADALLIDDIHFFAGKERSQEEFFHTFNSLLEAGRQIILTCDRYPAELDQLDARLQNRFSAGLSVAVDPPELETRVAILLSKAEQLGATIPEDVSFYIANRIRSNVRELEGALNRLVHTAGFTGNPITIEFARDVLQDILSVHERQVTIEVIQRTVAEYFSIRLGDLSSKSRKRSVTRPRQMAMALAKELTQRSLPEIGDAFGGRDHTTVLHACRTIKKLRDAEFQIRDDYNALFKTLSR